jgi:hypothetical protein
LSLTLTAYACSGNLQQHTTAKTSHDLEAGKNGVGLACSPLLPMGGPLRACLTERRDSADRLADEHRPLLQRRLVSKAGKAHVLSAQTE